MIDIIDIKKAVKRGDIEVFTAHESIFIKDAKTGESVKIGEIKRRNDELFPV